MKFTALVLGALAAVAAALPAFTNTQFDVEEGKPFTLNWIGTTNPVSLEILTGPDDKSLNPIKTIAASVTGSSFTYTPTGLPTGKYAFRITDTVTKENNYSVLFSYTGTAVSTTASSSRSASSTSVSSSSTTESSSTVTSASSTRSSSTSTSPTTTRSSPTNTPANNNEGQRFASPLALVLITVAALVFFN